MNCRHENADHLMPGELLVFSSWNSADHLVTVEQFRCLDCGAWLSLGPANDDSEQVKVEIRAAELAALDRDGKAVGQPLMFDAMTHGEYLGVIAHDLTDVLISEEPCNQCERSGYLARCIVEHDTAGEG